VEVVEVTVLPEAERADAAEPISYSSDFVSL